MAHLTSPSKRFRIVSETSFSVLIKFRLFVIVAKFDACAFDLRLTYTNNKLAMIRVLIKA